MIPKGLRSANSESRPSPTPGGAAVWVVSFQTGFYSNILFGYRF